MAQSLFQHGRIETTLIKAKEVRPFVERLVTLAKRGTLQSRQQIIGLLGDRPALDKEEQEKYDAMTFAQRGKVLVSRSGRRHRSGTVPAGYNKKKISFVARSIVHRLIAEIAPKFSDRPGGYTRIIRLPKRRIGDNSDLAILQLIGFEEEEAPKGVKRTVGQRRQRTVDRVRFLEGKAPRRKGRSPEKKPAAPTAAGQKVDAAAKEDDAPGDQPAT